MAEKDRPQIHETAIGTVGGVKVTWAYEALCELAHGRRSGTNAHDATCTYDAANRLRTLTHANDSTVTHV